MPRRAEEAATLNEHPATLLTNAGFLEERAEKEAQKIQKAADKADIDKAKAVQKEAVDRESDLRAEAVKAAALEDHEAGRDGAAVTWSRKKKKGEIGENFLLVDYKAAYSKYIHGTAGAANKKPTTLGANIQALQDYFVRIFKDIPKGGQAVLPLPALQAMDAPVALEVAAEERDGFAHGARAGGAGRACR